MIPIHLGFILVSLSLVERGDSADKWVWGEGGRSRSGSGERDHQQVSRESLEYDRKLEGIYSHERPSSRPAIFDDNVSKQSFNIPKYEKGRPLSNYKYEVHENGFGDYKPPAYRPSVPFALPNRPIPAVSKPSALPITLPSRPNPNYAGPQAAASSVGILTGPVPSWENAQSTHKNGDPTQFERCKCSFSFNCKDPGIQFGNCDVGKQYCCYNSKGVSSNAGFGSHLDVDRTDANIPAILAGPGGPVDNYNLAGPGPDASVDYPGSIPPFTKRPNPFGPLPPPNRGPSTFGPPPFGTGPSPFGTGPPPPPPPPSPFGAKPPIPPPPPPTPEQLIFPPPNGPFGPNGPNGPFNRPPPPPFYDYQSRTTNVTKIVSEDASNSED